MSDVLGVDDSLGFAAIAAVLCLDCLTRVQSIGRLQRILDGIHFGLVVVERFDDLFEFVQFNLKPGDSTLFRFLPLVESSFFCFQLNLFYVETSFFGILLGLFLVESALFSFQLSLPLVESSLFCFKASYSLFQCLFDRFKTPIM